MSDRFKALNRDFDDVFDSQTSLYNGASGKIQSFVNVGPTLPPRRKERLPRYNRTTVNELQDKFYELESVGVIAKPEQVNVKVEYLNPSFLVRKPYGGSRLVTSFCTVAQYTKPQPSLMPSADSVLRHIAKWNYIIVTDLAKAFYQVPLAHDSMKYRGVATPFKGSRVHQIDNGHAKFRDTPRRADVHSSGRPDTRRVCNQNSDDLGIGGNTPDEALYNWSRILAALRHNNLRISTKRLLSAPGLPSS